MAIWYGQWPVPSSPTGSDSAASTDAPGASEGWISPRALCSPKTRIAATDWAVSSPTLLTLTCAESAPSRGSTTGAIEMLMLPAAAGPPRQSASAGAPTRTSCRWCLIAARRLAQLQAAENRRRASVADQAGPAPRAAAPPRVEAAPPAPSSTRRLMPVAAGSSVPKALGMANSALSERRSRPGAPCRTETRLLSQSVCPERMILHGSSWQLAEQPSPDTVLPSSHCSPASTTPSPQRGSRWQVAEQPSPETVLPSSHCSPGSRMWLPHTSSRQLGEQPSPATVLPSSHCSPASSTPLPQSPAGARQLAVASVLRIWALTAAPNTRSMSERPPQFRWQ